MNLNEKMIYILISLALEDNGKKKGKVFHSHGVLGCAAVLKPGKVAYSQWLIYQRKKGEII